MTFTKLWKAVKDSKKPKYKKVCQYCKNTGLRTVGPYAYEKYYAIKCNHRGEENE